MGKFSARWKTDASGNAVFAVYKNDKNQTVDAALQGLTEFASSWKYKLFRFGEAMKEDYENDPKGHTLKISMTLMTMSLAAAVEPQPYSPGMRRGYTSLDDMSALGAETFLTALPNGSFYSVAFQTELPATLYPGFFRGAHFKEANTALSNVMATDNAFANQMKALGITIPRSSTGTILGRSPIN